MSLEKERLEALAASIERAVTSNEYTDTARGDHGIDAEGSKRKATSQSFNYSTRTSVHNKAEKMTVTGSLPLAAFRCFLWTLRPLTIIPKNNAAPLELSPLEIFTTAFFKVFKELGARSSEVVGLRFRLADSLTAGLKHEAAASASAPANLEVVRLTTVYPPLGRF